MDGGTVRLHHMNATAPTPITRRTPTDTDAYTTKGIVLSRSSSSVDGDDGFGGECGGDEGDVDGEGDG